MEEIEKAESFPGETPDPSGFIGKLAPNVNKHVKS